MFRSSNIPYQQGFVNCSKKMLKRMFEKKEVVLLECRKVYVDVSLDISKDGRVRPRTLRYEDGTVYVIEQVKDVRRAASVKVGGLGVRYTIMIRGHERYLFDESGKWFIEARVVPGEEGWE